MQCRRAVQQNRMSARHFVENVPNLRCLALNHFLRATNRVHVAEIFQSPNDERFKQEEGHLLRQTALMKFQFRTDDDHRSTRVIDPLAKQVLTEASPLAL